MSKKLAKYLAIGLIVAGVAWRLSIAWRFQSRAWIDEVWVLLNPAYYLLTGVGYLNPQDWGAPSPRGIRTWLPPGLLFFYLKTLSALGIDKGTIVLPLVRVTIAALSAASVILYARTLGQAMRLKLAPVLPLAVLLFTPQLVHYGAVHELSVVGFPALAIALALLRGGDEPVSPARFRVGAAFFSLSCLIRFQYALFAFVFVGWLIFRKRHRQALEFVGIALLFIAADTALNSWMFQRPILPAINFFLGNAIYGMGNDAGVMPLGAGFEFLWRYITEPVFALVFITLWISFKRARFLTLAAMTFYAIHVYLSHKEFRYFYAPAVLLAGLAASSLQAWVEDNWKRFGAKAALAAFCVLFAGFASWRGLKKTDWTDYEVPSRLETLAGIQPDVKGLFVYGWGGGIYCGGQYSFHRPLPYHCGMYSSFLREMKANPDDFNYLVTESSKPAPCAEVVARHGGGTLYRCTPTEVKLLFTR